MVFSWLRKMILLSLNFHRQSIKIIDLKSANLAHKITFSLSWKPKSSNLGMSKKA